jgi:hypothetical protein
MGGIPYFVRDFPDGIGPCDPASAFAAFREGVWPFS